MPSGGIIMWSGAENAIPTGWYLCNGSNNTPDLRDRFVIGAGSNYSVNDTGGSADAILVSHSHTINNHTHSFSGSGSDSVSISGSGSGTTGSQNRNHTHTGSTSASGNHYHGPSTEAGFDNQGNGQPLRALYEDGSPYAGTTWNLAGGNHTHSFTTSGVNQNHEHSFSFSFSGSDSVSISVSGTTGNPSNTGTSTQGSSATNANLPPYYALCFIMKA